MRLGLTLLAAISIAAAGCTYFHPAKYFNLSSYEPVTNLAEPEFYQYVESSDRNVLVEFCTSTNLKPQLDMTESLVRLADVYKDSTEIVRVDITGKTELLATFGGTQCPTYALFEQGQLDPVFVQSFPVTSDHLEAAVLASLALSDMDE